MDKVFIDAEAMLKDSFELGLRIAESDYHPSFVIGIWRGGAPIAIAIQELLDVMGYPTDHASLRTSSYGGGTTSRRVEVFGLAPVAKSLRPADRVLIVDDTFDTGRSVDAVITQLREAGVSCEIRVATLYFKPTLNKTERVPDYHLYETDKWLVFPHELRGADLNELKSRGLLPERIFTHKLTL
ncbi:phosphoribosyltransferase [Fretibacter rubidus]|uniref:phosphoribosyltransferase n=1 Tax=Fretibacter rubidus TaxID=570162 RepID=UPI00352A7073